MGVLDFCTIVVSETLTQALLEQIVKHLNLVTYSIVGFKGLKIHIFIE